MNKQTRGRFWRYGPLVLWVLLISFASTSEFSAENTGDVLRSVLLWFFPNLNEARLDTIHFLTRKAAHFTEYAVLAFLARRAFIGSFHSFLQRYWFELALLVVVMNGLLDEYHQSFVPSRTASIYDSAIDVAGGLTVLLVLKFFGKNRRLPASQSEAQTAA
jgi:VanZ family protein